MADAQNTRHPDLVRDTQRLAHRSLALCLAVAAQKDCTQPKPGSSDEDVFRRQGTVLQPPIRDRWVAAHDDHQRRTGQQPAEIELEPEPKAENILFHDGNDRDLERTMQDLVENFLTFRLANELMHSRLNLINTAIRERI